MPSPPAAPTAGVAAVAPMPHRTGRSAPDRGAPDLAPVAAAERAAAAVTEYATAG